jgi:hypothetical protein
MSTRFARRWKSLRRPTGHSVFQTDLDLRATTAPDIWALAAPLVWEDAIFGRLEVPVGFLTDLASIPRALRSLPFLDPNGVSRRPAAGHDWLYAAGRRFGKPFADSFLRASLLAEGASPATAWAFYQGVHLFGGPAWRSDERILGFPGDFDTIAHYTSWRSSPSGMSESAARSPLSLSGWGRR